MVVMLNYLKGIPISYLTRIMGFLPVIGFPFELLHRSVPSQVFSYAPYPSFVIALDGDPEYESLLVKLQKRDKTY